MQNGAVGSGPAALTTPVTVHTDPPPHSCTHVCLLLGLCECICNRVSCVGLGLWWLCLSAEERTRQRSWTVVHSAGLAALTCSSDVPIRCLSPWKCPDGRGQTLDTVKSSLFDIPPLPARRGSMCVKSRWTGSGGSLSHLLAVSVVTTNYYTYFVFRWAH